MNGDAEENADANQAPVDERIDINDVEPNANNQDAERGEEDERADSEDEAVDRLLEMACDAKIIVRAEFRQRTGQAAFVPPHAVNGVSKAALKTYSLKGKKVIFKQ